MLKKETRYGYKDVMVQPSIITDIEHRSECNPFKGLDISGKYNMLPIFTAPMSTVVCESNANTFTKNGIHPIIPRNVLWKFRQNYIKNGQWVALSLNEFEDYICNQYDTNKNEFPQTIHILIDVANGHMDKILELSKKAKKLYGKDHIKIMAGNIANPETYTDYCNAGIDYVRVGIGVGEGCITSSNTAINDGIASLLDDIAKIKQYRQTWNAFCSNVVADGGIRGYADVIRALALGADYVMIGGLLARTVESASRIYYKNELGEVFYTNEYNVVKHGDSVAVIVDNKFYPVYKEFYGMASKYGQIAINGKKTKTSEGLKKEVEVTTTLESWAKNMQDYLRSSMSYCNIKDIKNFNPENVTTQVISNNAANSINK